MVTDSDLQVEDRQMEDEKWANGGWKMFRYKDGICAYGRSKLCKWRMEDVQLEDGRCLGGV
jgi:hypothetical protein